MYKRVLETIHTHALVPDGATVVVGVSGGADSMALLDILARHSARHNTTLIVAHVRYGVRAASAARDRNYARRAAAARGLAFHEHTLAGTAHPTDEAWMREARYTFFRDVAAATGATRIAVGHTRDDLVETFLLNLLRGSGLAGLSALPYRRDAIIRPLLDVTRTDVERYCARRAITYGTDETNTDTTYRRNHIRHRFLPYLRRHYGAHISATLARTAHVVRDDYAALLDAYRAQRIPQQVTATSVTFRAADFLALSPAHQRLLLRRCAARLAHTTPALGTVEAWRKLIRSSKNKTPTITTRTLIVRKKGATVTMTRRD